MHTVAIVGRPNVGKSALFNRLAKRQISLVFDRPGTTRDRLVVECRWEDHHFTLIDTGGIGLEDSEGFSEAIAHEVDLALAAASEIIFVVDARQGVTPLDQEVAKKLRKSRCPVFIAANKVDDEQKQAHIEGVFTSLGFGSPYPVSAAHGLGIDSLLTAVTAKWTPEPEKEEEETAAFTRPERIAIVGRPNVGKSSLVNALVEETRAIVSETPGTTRDAVDISYRFEDREYLLIDTAGMRQKRRIDDELESAMTGRSAHAINRADVCVLVLDATVGVSMQEKKIAGLIQQAHCPCLVVVNKWDIPRAQGDAGRERERKYYEEVQQDLFFLHYAPVLFLSAKTGERLTGLMKAIARIAKTRHYRFQTGPLNRVLTKAIQKQGPPVIGGRRFKLLYAAQQQSERKDNREIPTLLLFVNQPNLLSASYQRYLEIQLREAFGLEGCPVKFVLRGRKEMKKD